jgi:hypothetical protein
VRTYTDFTNQILIGLYYWPDNPGQMVRLDKIAEKYAIGYKDGWLIDAQTDLEGMGYVVGPSNSRNDEMAAARITGAGRRHVESLIEDNENAQGWALAYTMINDHDGDQGQTTSAPDIGSVQEIAKVETALAPAAGRLVSFADNQLSAEQAIGEIQKAEEAIRLSNQIDPDEKADALVSLELGKELVRRSKSFLIGALRYLVLERLKKAFEKTIEDVYRLVLIGAFLTIGGLLLSLL